MFFNIQKNTFSCGIIHIGNFDNNKKYVEDLLIQSIRDCLTNLDDEIVGDKKYNPLVICSTNYEQVNTNKILREVKFQLIYSFINDNTGNQCYVWCKKLKEFVEEADKYFKFEGSLVQDYYDYIKKLSDGH